MLCHVPYSFRVFMVKLLLGVEEPSLFAVLPPSYEESVITGTPGTSG